MPHIAFYTMGIPLVRDAASGFYASVYLFIVYKDVPARPSSSRRFAPSGVFAPRWDYSSKSKPFGRHLLRACASRRRRKSDLFALWRAFAFAPERSRESASIASDTERNGPTRSAREGGGFPPEFRDGRIVRASCGEIGPLGRARPSFLYLERRPRAPLRQLVCYTGLVVGPSVNVGAGGGGRPRAMAGLWFLPGLAGRPALGPPGPY